jgi:hypothetical protein
MTTHILTTLSDTTATRLTPNGLHGGMDITIQNVDPAATVYIGGDGVTSSSFGYRLTPDQAWSVELPGTDALYAISSVDGTSVAVLQLGLESQG